MHTYDRSSNDASLVMSRTLTLLLSLCRLVSGAPMANASETITEAVLRGRRQVDAPVLDEQVAFVTVTELASTQLTMTATEVVTVDVTPTGEW